MKAKRIIALLVSAVLLLTLFAGCKTDSETTTTGTVDPNTVAKIDWAPYDKLIKDIKSSTDFVAREALMHQAEDILMNTGAVCPIYHYNDVYMMKKGVEGFYATLYGFKYFMFTTFGANKTLRINLASEPDKLDPALNSSVDGACLAANSFSGLYTYAPGNKLVPDLAAAAPVVSDDGLTYTFTMKDGLKWSDGSPLNAKDLEYSWKRAAATKTAADYSYMFNGIEGFPDNLNVKASDDGKTLTVVLTAPCPYFLDLCAFPTFYAVNKATVEAGATAENPGAWATEAGFVTSGAYTLKEWKHDQSMVYEKNPNYWNAANVTMDRLEFMLSADDTAIFAAYKAGNLDFIDTVPADETKNLLKDPEFYIVDNLGTYYICFNVKSDLFKGKTVEQASAMRRGIGLLINRQYIIDTVGQTGQHIATTFIPDKAFDGHGGIFKTNDDAYTYPNKDAVGYYAEDGDEAAYKANVAAGIELLKSAGFEFGADNKLKASTPISFEYIINENTGHQAIAECIQQDLKAVGITMTIKTVDWDTLLNERKSGNFDVSRNGWVMDFNDPINMLEMWTSDSGNNDCQFGK